MSLAITLIVLGLLGMIWASAGFACGVYYALHYYER